MAKKKKDVPVTESLHFRPSSTLGTLINRFAEERGLTRVEAAKRLLSLGGRGLNTQFYDLICELSACMYGDAFDEACEHVRVEIACTTGSTQQEPPEEEKLAIARRLLERIRVVYGRDTSVGQQQRVQIHDRNE